jgi:ribosome modulation factor
VSGVMGVTYNMPRCRLIKLTATYWVAVLPQRYHSAFGEGYRARVRGASKNLPPAAYMTQASIEAWQEGWEAAREAGLSKRKVSVVLDYEL